MIVGQDEPAAPVSGEISVETARMPEGRIAAMNPEPLGLISLASRIGSPATSGVARERAGQVRDRIRPVGSCV